MNWKRLIGIDREGLHRIGVNPDMGFSGWLCFVFGMMFFAPALLFIRRNQKQGGRRFVCWLVGMTIICAIIFLAEVPGGKYELYWMDQSNAGRMPSAPARALLIGSRVVQDNAWEIGLVSAILLYVLSGLFVKVTGRTGAKQAAACIQA